MTKVKEKEMVQETVQNPEKEPEQNPASDPEKEPTIGLDDVKAAICEVLHSKAQDMLKGPDRVNDPQIMHAMAELYSVIK